MKTLPTFEMTNTPLVWDATRKTTLSSKIELGIVLKGVFALMGPFTKADFIESGIRYLKLMKSGHTSEKSMITTLNFTFSWLKKNGNLVAVS